VGARRGLAAAGGPHCFWVTHYGCPTKVAFSCPTARRDDSASGRGPGSKLLVSGRRYQVAGRSLRWIPPSGQIQFSFAESRPNLVESRFTLVESEFTLVESDVTLDENRFTLDEITFNIDKITSNLDKITSNLDDIKLKIANDGE
jgi:hypothetical protein